MTDTKSFTISAPLVRHQLLGAQAAGIDIDQVLRKQELDPALLHQPEGRIAVEKVVAMQRYCNGKLNDEVTGLLAKPLRLGHFRMMALCAVNAASLEEALERCIAFYNLFENSFYYRFERQKGQARLWLEPIPDQPIQDPFAVDFLLSVFHRFIGWLGNHRIVLNQVKMAFPPPEYLKEYQYTYYGAPVLFNQPLNGLSFDEGYLKHPVVQNEAAVESYIRRAPLDLYLPVDAGGETTEAIRLLAQQIFKDTSGVPSLDEIASALELTPQTLRRRLKCEGTSFHTIKAQLRRDIAIHHLGNAELSIEAIAEKAGYSEPSAFIRAFKSWTGFTPLQFRKGLESKY
ncbi:AraC family transcriptional regulator [Motiliproteus coralliicola]|uniref:AraC family transcriptional regulator n=1 Tax=Motiliproteus coralliicola TaxID=2283196 RepID=A0A369WRV0_9GAMM|nr:AraC family transcriptional regulator [Motiliproteus coralliicola]RDE24402.1 AraC family transcriptional regulator [Motiliproteus coralliicola]